MRNWSHSVTENTTTNEAQMKSNKVEEKTPTGTASSSKSKYSSRNENDEDENDEFYDSESEPSFIDSPEKSSSSSSPPSNHQQQQIPQTPVSLKSHQQTTTFYAVQFSTDESAKKAVSTSNGNNSRIFCNKENAMKLCKLDPENRTFKALIVIHYIFSMHHRYLISPDFRFKGIHELQRSVYIQFRGNQ